MINQWTSSVIFHHIGPSMCGLLRICLNYWSIVGQLGRLKALHAALISLASKLVHFHGKPFSLTRFNQVLTITCCNYNIRQVLFFSWSSGVNLRLINIPQIKLSVLGCSGYLSRIFSKLIQSARNLSPRRNHCKIIREGGCLFIKDGHYASNIKIRSESFGWSLILVS